MAGLPRLGHWDLLAIGGVLALLVVAYVLVPDRIVQYGAWLAIFSIWMLWFVSFGVRWLYGEEA